MNSRMQPVLREIESLSITSDTIIVLIGMYFVNPHESDETNELRARPQLEPANRTLGSGLYFPFSKLFCAVFRDNFHISKKIKQNERHLHPSPSNGGCSISKSI